MAHLKTNLSPDAVRAVFSLLALIPLILFMLALHNGFPPFLGFSHLLGVPVSILLLLALMFFQVALTGCYLHFVAEVEDTES